MTDISSFRPEQVREYTAGRVLSAADRYILEELKKKSPDTVVEIGCGPGTIAGRTLFVEKYICTDITIEFLRVASKARPSGVFLNCRAETLPLRNGMADCVVAMAVLHHLNKKALRHSLNEIHRILKPNGIFLLLEDWCFEKGITGFEEEARKWRFRNGSNENHLTADNWLREIRTAGFSCRNPVWTERPFRTSASHLIRWPEVDRKVRMMALESVRQ
ncbi:MAG: class I SAM-dependent methyltransferase [Candidatus Aegiribacteria sp.]|jgi:SAM-dependent methyltransferase|nr:class I SAM-dependent methyltransferase [Candidatus Aegiribacteria sp.]